MFSEDVHASASRLRVTLEKFRETVLFFHPYDSLTDKTLVREEIGSLLLGMQNKKLTTRLVLLSDLPRRIQWTIEKKNLETIGKSA